MISLALNTFVSINNRFIKAVGYLSDPENDAKMKYAKAMLGGIDIYGIIWKTPPEFVTKLYPLPKGLIVLFEACAVFGGVDKALRILGVIPEDKKPKLLTNSVSTNRVSQLEVQPSLVSGSTEQPFVAQLPPPALPAQDKWKNRSFLFLGVAGFGKVAEMLMHVKIPLPQGIGAYTKVPNTSLTFLKLVTDGCVIGSALCSIVSAYQRPSKIKKSDSTEQLLDPSQSKTPAEGHFKSLWVRFTIQVTVICDSKWADIGVNVFKTGVMVVVLTMAALDKFDTPWIKPFKVFTGTYNIVSAFKTWNVTPKD